MPDSQRAFPRHLRDKTAGPIYIVRHGQTEWNRLRRYQGRTDIPLNATGRQQALAYAGRIRTYFSLCSRPLHFSGCIASPLSRTRETAAILCQSLGGSRAGLPESMEAVSTDARLFELNYGLWEGLYETEIKERFAAGFEQRRTDYAHFRADGGESAQELCCRVAEAFSSMPGGTLCVCHHGTITGLALSLHGSLPLLRIPQDTLYILDGDTLIAADEEFPAGHPVLF